MLHFIKLSKRRFLSSLFNVMLFFSQFLQFTFQNLAIGGRKYVDPVYGGYSGKICQILNFFEQYDKILNTYHTGFWKQTFCGLFLVLR
jgi:hypothetical protein